VRQIYVANSSAEPAPNDLDKNGLVVITPKHKDKHNGSGDAHNGSVNTSLYMRRMDINALFSILYLLMK